MVGGSGRGVARSSQKRLRNIIPFFFFEGRGGREEERGEKGEGRKERKKRKIKETLLNGLEITNLLKFKGV